MGLHDIAILLSIFLGCFGAGALIDFILFELKNHGRR